jgi:hypothetical protein
MLSDKELDRLLAHATDPELPIGFEAILLAKLNGKNCNNVLAFPPNRKPDFFLLGLPLAASLMLGLWLGSAGTIDGYLHQIGSSLAANDTTNLDEFDLIIEEQQS